MPTLAFPWRYRPPVGLAGDQAGLLSPFEDDTPDAFDPSSLDTPSQQPESYGPPPPMQPPQAKLNDTQAGATLATPPPLNPGEASNASLSGVKRMPPPGGPAASYQPPPPPSAAQLGPRPSAPQNIGDVDQQIATSATGNPVNNGPIEQAQEPTTPQEKLKALRESELGQSVLNGPKSNWAQRLGMAILSTTKLAPAANSIVHPKYTEQARNFATQEGDLEEQQKEQNTAASTASLVEQRAATADQRRALGQDYAVREQERQAGIEQRDRSRVLESFDRVVGKDASPQPAEQPVPEGYTAYKDPLDPSTVWVKRSVFTAAPKELIESGQLPGFKAGQPVDSKTLAGAYESYWKQQAQAAKPGATAKTEVQLAVEAQDSDPKVSGPAKAALKQMVTQHVAEHPVNNNTVQLSPEAIKGIGETYGKTGNLPPMGYGNAGANARNTVLNQFFKGNPNADIASVKADFSANSDSLKALQKNRDAVVAFENTAGKNLDLFLQQAKGVIDTGSPWVNQPLRAINKTVLGGADQAAYEAARRVALNEIAKVTSNPGLSGQLSDSARHEIESISPESATLSQLYRVAAVLKGDMANRHASYDQMLHEVRGRIQGPSSPQGAAPAPQQPSSGAPLEHWVRDQSGKLVKQ